jgi:hypothetical protein
VDALDRNAAPVLDVQHGLHLQNVLEEAERYLLLTLPIVRLTLPTRHRRPSALKNPTTVITPPESATRIPSPAVVISTGCQIMCRRATG